MTTLLPSASGRGDQAFMSDLQGLLHETVTDLGASAPTYLADLVRQGGHGFRPRLVEETAFARSRQSHRGLTLRLAASVEVLHVASLIHDDYVDGAHSRRGLTTPRATIGGESTLLLGTSAAIAAAMIAHDEGADFSYYFLECAESLAAGQLADVQRPIDKSIPFARYTDLLRKKSGSLMALAVLFGARAAGPVDTAQMKSLTALGHEIGVSFQIADDIEDFQDAVVGKPRGLDSVNGLPLTCIVMADGRPASPESLRDEALRLLDSASERWSAEFHTHPDPRGTIATLRDRLERPA